MLVGVVGLANAQHHQGQGWWSMPNPTVQQMANDSTSLLQILQCRAGFQGFSADVQNAISVCTKELENRPHHNSEAVGINE